MRRQQREPPIVLGQELEVRAESGVPDEGGMISDRTSNVAGTTGLSRGFRPLLIVLATDEDAEATSELRDLALGRSDSDRWLFVAFTVRGELIRVISVRDMTRSERKVYEEAIQSDEA